MEGENHSYGNRDDMLRCLRCLENILRCLFLLKEMGYNEQDWGEVRMKCSEKRNLCMKVQE